MLQVTLYSKPQCGLCDYLKQDLALLRKEIEFTWIERNIEENPEDFERFRYLIPVLDIHNSTLLYPPHDLYRVRAALLEAVGNLS